MFVLLVYKQSRPITGQHMNLICWPVIGLKKISYLACYLLSITASSSPRRSSAAIAHRSAIRTIARTATVKMIMLNISLLPSIDY